MKNLSKLIFTLMIVVVSFGLFAQESNDNVVLLEQIYEENLNKMNDQWLLSESQISAIQEGCNNTLSVNQYSLGNFKEGNVIFIMQSGDDNTGIIDQGGYNNRIGLIQEGEDNYSEVSVMGESINSMTIQQGEQNNITLDLQGYGYENIILQEGYDNNIYQEFRGTTNQGIQIEQRGVGMDLIIRTNW